MSETAAPVYQFINSMYLREKYEKNGRGFEKVRDDALIIAYKKDGKPLFQIIENPKFTFRVAKKDVKISNFEDNIPIEQTDTVTVPYHDLTKYLAQIGGKEQIYFNLKRDKEVDWKTKRNFENSLHLNNRVFGSDINIEDQYKIDFVTRYGVNIGGYRKGVFDIETDGKGNGVIDPHAAKDPVYAISYYDFYSKTMYVFVLDDEARFSTTAKFKKALADRSFVKKLYDDPEMNGQFELAIDPKKPAAITNVNIKYDIQLFEQEFDLICAFYDTVHKCTPDIMLAWNFTFDNLVLHNRLRQFAELSNGAFRMEDIVCHPDIPKQYREVLFKEDMSPRAEYYNKWHVFTIPDHTSYICSMATYAHIRKSKGVLPSYALDDIAEKELRKGKHDYHDIATDVLELPHADYETSIFYNIKDSWLLAELEAKNNDVDSIMYMAECTRLSQVTKQTAVIRNAQYMFYSELGLAMGNNINAMIEQPEIHYEGALVADPQLNEPQSSPLFPYPVKTIRPYVIDNDLASMYPSIAISHNIYKTTLLTHMYKIGATSPFADAPGIFDVSECMDNYQCNRATRWGHDYLGLPDVGDMIKIINSELLKIEK